MSLCAVQTNPGGCDVGKAGGVCGVPESSPHAGRPGLSGLDHMCLEGVRGSEKTKQKKKLVKNFGKETENFITFGGLSGKNIRLVFNIRASVENFQQLL